MPAFLVIWLLVGIGCGAYASSIAAEKNRSGAAFFFFGLLFGPIGLHAAYTMPDGHCKPAKGWITTVCPRCSARQNVIHKDNTDYECWQCHQINQVKIASPPWVKPDK